MTADAQSDAPAFDRPMTADEQRGFNLACACMITWGTQIVRSGAALPPIAPDHVPIQLMAERGRFLVFAAEALQRTLGQPAALPRVAPSLA